MSPPTSIKLGPSAPSMSPQGAQPTRESDQRSSASTTGLAPSSLAPASSPGLGADSAARDTPPAPPASAPLARGRDSYTQMVTERAQGRHVGLHRVRIGRAEPNLLQLPHLRLRDV